MQRCRAIRTGVDFIQEQVQALGASAEFGNVQGAVINVITRQGSERLLFDSSYCSQPQAFTSQPVTIKYDGGRRESGYERSRYRDFTSTSAGRRPQPPLVLRRLPGKRAITTASRERIRSGRGPTSRTRSSRS